MCLLDVHGSTRQQAVILRKFYDAIYDMVLPWANELNKLWSRDKSNFDYW